jgi:hypothetical protein
MTPPWGEAIEAGLDDDLARGTSRMSPEYVRATLAHAEAWQRLIDGKQGHQLAEEANAMCAEAVRLRDRGELAFSMKLLPGLRNQVLNGSRGRDLERLLMKLRARVAADEMRGARCHGTR